MNDNFSISGDTSAQTTDAERMMNDALNESMPLPLNVFPAGTQYVPVGGPETLDRIANEVRNGTATIIGDCSTRDINVFHIVVRRGNTLNEVWVNRVWYDRIMSGVTSGDTDSRQVLSGDNDTPVIPENSPTISQSDVTSRFSGAVWYEEILKQRIILAGVGGIGSFLGFLLSRLHVYRITLYDPDIVEEGNMSGQMYGRQHIGKAKVSALSQVISYFSDYYDLDTYEERFTLTSDPGDIMMCGFDNMTSRKNFYSSWLAHVDNHVTPEKCLFIDGRLAAEEFQVFTIQGSDRRAMEEYESKWLFDDSEAEETICSYKQTTFMANMIASVMANCFVNFVANQLDPVIERAVPFMVTYDAGTMFTKTVM